MKKGLWVLILALLSVTYSVSDSGAADEAIAKGVKISGFVDTYYSYNFNDPDSRKNGVGTNFDLEHNTFSLNLAEMVVSRTAEPVGFRIDLDFGPTTDFVHCGKINCIDGDKESTFKNIQQAYVSWATPFKLNLDYGKFVTHMGAEVIESKDNWNYTRGLLFCCAIPYYHAGLRANYPISDKLFVNGYIYNGWNNVTENNGSKTFGVQVGITPIPQLPIILSWIGPEDFVGSANDRQVYEAIVSYNATDSLSFMVDYNYGTQDSLTGTSQKYSGIAAYAKWKQDPYTLALRYEIADDKDNAMFAGTTPDGNKIQEITLTSERTLAGSLLTRLEYRVDMSDDKIYEDKDGKFIEDSQSRVVLGLVYTF